MTSPRRTIGWRVTIDQRTPQGATQRYEHASACDFMGGALDEALAQFGLVGVVEGEYQVTFARWEAQ